jgi:hypothetical protein
MAFSIRRLYYYLVCFTTLIMTIVGTVQIVDRALDVAMPGLYGSSEFELRQRFEMPHRADMAPPPPNEAQIRQMVIAEQERERNRALRSMLGSIALVLIAFPVYLYHWRRVRRSEMLE